MLRGVGLTRAVRDEGACAHGSNYYIRYLVTSFSFPNWNELVPLFTAAAELTCPSVICDELQGV